MRMKLNLDGLLEEANSEENAIPYLLKMYLRDKVGIPVIINPLDPYEPSIEVSEGEIKYEFDINPDHFSVDIEYNHPHLPLS